MKNIDKYLSVWIFLAMFLGFGIGLVFPNIASFWANFEYREMNVLLILCLIIMMYPPLAKVDYGKMLYAFRSYQIMLLSLVLNWLIAPLLMFLLAIVFLRDEPLYMQGLIIIGLARCVAMVVVWSDLAKGDREYTAALVALNSLFQIVGFGAMCYIYLVWLPNMFGLEIANLSNVNIGDIASNVLLYLGVPFALGFLSRFAIVRYKGINFYNDVFLPSISPLTLITLLFTIVMMCSYRADKIISLPLDTLRIAMPLALYFAIMFYLSWFVCRWFDVWLRNAKWGDKAGIGTDKICSISLSASGNNFELAIAVCIASFGIYSNQAFAAIIGPLIEVPFLLLLVKWVLWQRNTMKSQAS